MPGMVFKRTALTTLCRRMRKLRRRRTFTILLNNLQRARADAVQIKELLFSGRFRAKSFNFERHIIGVYDTTSIYSNTAHLSH